MDKNLPLVILSCSQVKRASDGPVPFAQLYDGPLWRQVKATIPASNIGCISAEHGLLVPGDEIETYDRKMDEDRLIELLSEPGVLEAFDRAVADYGLVLIIGGELYKLFALTLIALRPALVGKIRFCLGSYLQQRKAVKQVMDEIERMTSCKEAA